MKKTDKQLQQEVTEIRRFIDGDSKQTAKKVTPIAYNATIGTMIGYCPVCETIPFTGIVICAYLPELRAELDWSEME